jgi:hypothetical protein
MSREVNHRKLQVITDELGRFDSVFRPLDPNVHEDQVGTFTLSDGDGLLGRVGDSDRHESQAGEPVLNSSAINASSSTMRIRIPDVSLGFVMVYLEGEAGFRARIGRNQLKRAVELPS